MWVGKGQITKQKQTVNVNNDRKSNRIVSPLLVV